MPSYAELVFHMFKMSSAVDCRGSKLITPDYYYWLWAFLYGLRLSAAPDTGMHILLLQYFVYSKYFDVFKVSILSPCNKTAIQSEAD